MRISKETVIAIVILAVIGYWAFLHGGLPSIPLPNFNAQDENINVSQEQSNNGAPENNGSSYFESRDKAIEVLDSIPIAEADNSEYNSSIRGEQWGGWKDIKGWNTREEVLALTAKNDTRENNAFTSGTWHSEYTGQNIVCETKQDVSKNLQIDHIIPVSYVHHHGGAAWDQDKKQEYYNDYGTDTEWTTGVNGSNDYSKCGVLIAVDSRSNMQKSDKGPSQWLPSNESYRKRYCEQWVVIASNWGVSLSQADHDTILKYLEAA